MLDKIKDIQLNLNASRNDYYTGQYKRNSVTKRDFQYNDSLKCSEAIQYVMQKKWQIKELFFSSGKNLSISFVTSDLEFHTTIDTGELNSLSKINYSISSVKDVNDIKKRLTASISMDITDENSNDKNIVSELPGIKMLIKRLFSLNIENELNSDDSSVLNNLFDDIIEFISFDMNYVNYSLFEFIMKLTGSKINLVPNKDYPVITLNKIQVVKI